MTIEFQVQRLNQLWSTSRQSWSTSEVWSYKNTDTLLWVNILKLLMGK